MKLSVPIIATLMAAFANTMATADSSAASVSASGKSGKSADGGYGYGYGCAGPQNALLKLQAAQNMAFILCGAAIALGYELMPYGEEAVYDLTTMFITADQVVIFEQLGLFVATELWKEDGAIAGTVPDNVIDGVELVSYYLLQLEGMTCEEVTQIIATDYVGPENYVRIG